MNPAGSNRRVGETLRIAALVATVAGALGSIGFMLQVGRHNPSSLLQILFTIWVLSPFVGLYTADAVSKDRTVRVRTMLHLVMLLVAAGSLVAYGEVALGPPRAKPAFMFLVVPLVSWLLMATIASIAALLKDGPDA